MGEGSLEVIEPDHAALFIPPGLSSFKVRLFEQIGATIVSKGGQVVRHDFAKLAALPDDVAPIVGCTPELRPIIDAWKQKGRTWVYWDRGYCDRVFATCLPTGEDGGFYRWHVGAYQLRKVRDVPHDRWKRLKVSTALQPWRKGGRHIVIAAPTRTYCRFHRCENWIADTIDALARVTDRQLVIRDKEQYRRRPIQKDIDGAHCLVTHGSNAAVESVILGCPVFVHPDSAAALVGKTSLNEIERPVYPDREKWLHSLAYSQFSEAELIDGTLWRLLQ